MRSHDSCSYEAINQEAAARATLLSISPRKWRLIRAFETLAQLLKPLVHPLPPTETPFEPPANILVVEYWNLGDLAILVPFLKNLRHCFPLAKISLLLNSGLPGLLDGQGLVDEFVPARVPWARHFSRWRKYNPLSPDWISLARTILALRKRRFDWAFSGRMDVRDNFLLWLSGARRRIAYSIGGGGSFLTDRVSPDFSHPHRADLWLHLLRSVNVMPDKMRPGYFLTDSDRSFAQSYLASLRIPPNAFLVGVHPGARLATRRWGDDGFAEVARRILGESDVHVLWFSEPGSSRRVPSLERCHSVSLDFRGFLAVLSRCRLLVCNDSGPMHLTNLLGVPVVAVFGPQRPEWFGPRGPQDRVVIHPEFLCRPCSDYCIYDQPYCLRAISVDEVRVAVQCQMHEIRQAAPAHARIAATAEPFSHV